jgi:hypothetical protein
MKGQERTIETEDIIRTVLRDPREPGLSFAYPGIAAQWYYPKNGTRSPEKSYSYSYVAVWWRCDHGHIWQETIRHRTMNLSECPECAHGQPIINLSYCPDALSLFDRARNEGIDPCQLPRQERVWWRCGAGPDHAWQSTYSKGKDRCPFCRGAWESETTILSKAKDNLSDYPTIAIQLHKRNGLLPEDIPCLSNLYFWWFCPEGPDHIWQERVSVRINNGGSCPFCSNEQLSTTNCLATVYPCASGSLRGCGRFVRVV